MTDGIIQEVLNKFNKTHRRGCQCDRCLVISYIKLELIEKIKQIPIEDYFYHYKPNHWSCSSKCNLNIIKTLIGDNQ